MNPRLRFLFIGIGIVTLLILSIVIIPRSISLYYQVKGGQLVQSALRLARNIPDIGLTCEPLPASREEIRATVGDAVSLLTRASKLNKQNAQTFLHLGQAYCLLGDPIHAKENYLTYSQLKPDNPLWYMGLGFAYEKLGDETSAVESWLLANINATDFQETGDEAFNAEKNRSAIRWYERALLLDPAHAQSWISIGQVYEVLSEPKNALLAYEKAWNTNPELGTTAFVNALKQRGDYGTIEEVLLETLKKVQNSPGRLLWWLDLGNALRSQEKWDEAIGIYQEAIQEFPEEPELHNSLGWTYYERGDGIQAAQREFEQAIALNENNAEEYFTLAQLYSREKLYQEAEIYYQKALEQEPNNRWYNLALADNIRLRGDLAASLEIYKDIIARFPDFAHGHYHIALAFRLNKQPEEAIKAIERALDLRDPPVDSYYARAGEIYRWAGLKEKALTAYHQALILNPDNSVAEKGLQLIGEQ